MTLYIVRYGELFLKSENVRKRFEGQLVSNILAAMPHARISRRRGRVLVDCDGRQLLGKIFGIVSFSKAQAVEPTVEAMARAAIPLVKPGTFALRVNRPYKKFPMTSQEIAVEVGSEIVKAKGNKVNLSSPSQEIFIEVFEDVAYVFTEKSPGSGGLPLGTAGRVLLLNDGKNAERAGWMMMKRGCTLDVLGERSPLLESWSIGHPINYVSGDAKELMKGYPALVTGSTKIPTEKMPCPVFQPLMGVL